MKNWKTFASGVLLAVCLNGQELGLPPVVAKWGQMLAAVALGSASKDKDVTGVGTDAKRKGEI